MSSSAPTGEMGSTNLRDASELDTSLTDESVIPLTDELVTSLTVELVEGASLDPIIATNGSGVTETGKLLDGRFVDVSVDDGADSTGHKAG